MELNHAAKPLHITLSLFLSGLIVVPNVLNRGRESLAQTTQTAQTKDKSASEAGLVRQYLDGMQKLRGGDLTSEARAQLQQEMAQKRAQLRELRKQTRLAHGILPFGPPPGGAKRTAPASAASDGQKMQSAQRCVACMHFRLPGRPGLSYPERDAGYEPYVFTAMAILVIAAYHGGSNVTVEYENLIGVNDQPISIEVK